MTAWQSKLFAFLLKPLLAKFTLSQSAAHTINGVTGSMGIKDESLSFEPNVSFLILCLAAHSINGSLAVKPDCFLQDLLKFLHKNIFDINNASYFTQLFEI